MRIAAIILLLMAQQSVHSEDEKSAQPDPLRAWQGTWNVIDNQASAGITFIIGEQLGLSGKDVKATIKGNQLLVDDKIIATLMTDYDGPQKLDQEIR